MHGLHRMYLGHGNRFGHSRMVLKVMYVKWKLVSVCFEIVLVLAQDRCTVCAECTSGMEIILAHPMVLLTNVDQEEARFDPFGDTVNLSAR